MNSLQYLATHSRIVADSSQLEELELFSGLYGVTTNPSLVLQALDKSAAMDNLVYEAMRVAAENKHQDLIATNDYLLALIGSELYRLFGVQVSLEVDARLADDTEATVARAMHIVELCTGFSMPADKLLIKIAATEAGIEAVSWLEQKGICCNVTLVFCLEQAVAAAAAGAWLISPFVGRVSDWFAINKPEQTDNCPGVSLVQTIQGYMRQHNYATKVMAASFRNSDQILKLCGTDLLTISPALLRKLERLNVKPEPYLSDEEHSRLSIARGSLHKNMSKNPMATELLADGIKRFVVDQDRMEQLLKEHIRA